MDYMVRPMTLGDLPQVIEIERESFPSPWSEDYFRHELEVNQVARYLVVCRGLLISGYIGVWLIVGEIHFTTIAVRPSDRRRGLGELLLISAIELALEYGAHFITLEVNESNLPARNLYRKYGFAEMGVRPGYYTETGADAIIMSVENIDSPSYHDNFQRLRQLCAERTGFAE